MVDVLILFRMPLISLSSSSNLTSNHGCNTTFNCFRIWFFQSPPPCKSHSLVTSHFNNLSPAASLKTASRCLLIPVRPTQESSFFCIMLKSAAHPGFQTWEYDYFSFWCHGGSTVSITCASIWRYDCYQPLFLLFPLLQFYIDSRCCQQMKIGTLPFNLWTIGLYNAVHTTKFSNLYAYIQQVRSLLSAPFSWPKIMLFLAFIYRTHIRNRSLIKDVVRES